ncbi:MAG: DeoR/GlpR family DNA-binding transcription regulator [Acidobacteriaceae bacterium]|nr:DeoR/GlpR family DNA-binding transcription regulator [Acidobacteriaceae bacterium]
MKKNNKNANALNPEERQNEILLYLKEKGTAGISAIAEEFAVSEMTVRRVLHKLSDASLVIRTPGGAMVAPSGSMERTFLERSGEMSQEKDALGRAAAALVQEGETIVLDSGTTTRYIARHLVSKKNLVVITTSLAILEELAGSPGIQVRLTGGVYRRVSHDVCGNVTEEALGNIYADRAFFGAAALSLRKGVMNYDPEMSKAILQAGKQRVLVIDSSKVGVEAVYRFCSVEQCDLVITDHGIKTADLKKLRSTNHVIIAE